MARPIIVVCNNLTNLIGPEPSLMIGATPSAGVA